MATCPSIISKEQTAQLLLSLCHHFPLHAQNVHMASYLQLREQDRCSGRSSHYTHSLGGEDRALRADGQKDRLTDRQMPRWEPLTSLPTHVTRQPSHLLRPLFASLGAGVMLVVSPGL